MPLGVLSVDVDKLLHRTAVDVVAPRPPQGGASLVPSAASSSSAPVRRGGGGRNLVDQPPSGSTTPRGGVQAAAASAAAGGGGGDAFYIRDEDHRHGGGRPYAPPPPRGSSLSKAATPRRSKNDAIASHGASPPSSGHDPLLPPVPAPTALVVPVLPPRKPTTLVSSTTCDDDLVVDDPCVEHQPTGPQVPGRHSMTNEEKLKGATTEPLLIRSHYRPVIKLAPPNVSYQEQQDMKQQQNAAHASGLSQSGTPRSTSPRGGAAGGGLKQTRGSLCKGLVSASSSHATVGATASSQQPRHHQAEGKRSGVGGGDGVVSNDGVAYDSPRVAQAVSSVMSSLVGRVTSMPHVADHKQWQKEETQRRFGGQRRLERLAYTRDSPRQFRQHRIQDAHHSTNDGDLEGDEHRSPRKPLAAEHAHDHGDDQSLSPVQQKLFQYKQNAFAINQIRRAATHATVTAAPGGYTGSAATSAVGGGTPRVGDSAAVLSGRDNLLNRTAQMVYDQIFVPHVHYVKPPRRPASPAPEIPPTCMIGSAPDTTSGKDHQAVVGDQQAVVFVQQTSATSSPGRSNATARSPHRRQPSAVIHAMIAAHRVEQANVRRIKNDVLRLQRQIDEENLKSIAACGSLSGSLSGGLGIGSRAARRSTFAVSSDSGVGPAEGQVTAPLSPRIG